MNKFILFAATCLMACGLFLTVQPASAATASYIDYSGAWEPYVFHGADYTFTFNRTDTTMDLAFGIAANNESLDLIKSKDTDGATVIFYEYGDVWKARELVGSGEILNLGSENHFTFYLGDDENYDVYKIGEFSWDLVFDNGVIVNVDNVSPVPIPTAILLLGSGLVGLAGFRRKIRQ